MIQNVELPRAAWDREQVERIAKRGSIKRYGRTKNIFALLLAAWRRYR